MLRVADGVAHRVPVELHAHHLLCPVGGSQADGADAAVGIQHDLSAGQLGGLHGQTIEHRRLHRVHLIEAAGAERVGLAAEFIQNEPLAVEHLFLLAQHNAGAAGVVVLHDGRHGDLPLFSLCQQGADKVLCAGQNGLGRDQHHHHLPGGGAPAQQAVAEQAGALVFPERLIPAGRCRCADGFQHGIQHLVFQQAALHRQHLMGPGGIDAGHEFSTLPGGKGRDHLIPIVVRRLHPPDGVHRAVSAQQGADFFLLLLQLVCIGQFQQRAAAAVLCAIFTSHRSFLLFPARCPASEAPSFRLCESRFVQHSQYRPANGSPFGRTGTRSVTERAHPYGSYRSYSSASACFSSSTAIACSSWLWEQPLSLTRARTASARSPPKTASSRWRMVQTP